MDAFRVMKESSSNRKKAPSTPYYTSYTTSTRKSSRRSKTTSFSFLTFFRNSFLVFVVILLSLVDGKRLDCFEEKIIGWISPAAGSGSADQRGDVVIHLAAPHVFEKKNEMDDDNETVIFDGDYVEWRVPLFEERNEDLTAIVKGNLSGEHRMYGSISDDLRSVSFQFATSSSPRPRFAYGEKVNFSLEQRSRNKSIGIQESCLKWRYHRISCPPSASVSSENANLSPDGISPMVASSKKKEGSHSSSKSKQCISENLSTGLSSPVTSARCITKCNFSFTVMTRDKRPSSKKRSEEALSSLFSQPRPRVPAAISTTSTSSSSRKDDKVSEEANLLRTTSLEEEKNESQSERSNNDTDDDDDDDDDDSNFSAKLLQLTDELSKADWPHLDPLDLSLHRSSSSPSPLPSTTVFATSSTKDTSSTLFGDFTFPDDFIEEALEDSQSFPEEETSNNTLNDKDEVYEDWTIQLPSPDTLPVEEDDDFEIIRNEELPFLEKSYDESSPSFDHGGLSNVTGPSHQLAHTSGSSSSSFYTPSVSRHYRTIPADFPHMATFNSRNKKGQIEGAKGLIYSAYLRHPMEASHNYLIIANQLGDVVFQRRLARANTGWHGWTVRDFKLQGNKELTYHDRWINGWIVLNRNYQLGAAGVIRPRNGMGSDGHSMKIRPDGHKLFLTTDHRYHNLQTHHNGHPNAHCLGFALQELDSKGHLVFHWSSWDHFPFQFGESSANVRGPKVDHLHANMATWAPDGDIVVSMRHMNQIIKIDRQSGNIMWRLGGKGGTIKVPYQHRFSHQHDAILHPQSKITFYDNGNLLRRSPSYSRGVEFGLNGGTAKLLWQFKNSPPIFGNAMGGVQTLANGNKLISWGGTERRHSNPVCSEVTRKGRKVFQMKYIKDGALTYKSRKKKGFQPNPLWPPRLIVRITKNQSTLHYSLNGAVDVHSWKIYAGSSNPRHLVRHHKRKRFESFTRIPTSAQWNPATHPKRCIRLKVVPVKKNGKNRTSSRGWSSPACRKK